jgi:hypothetical protein
VVRSSREKLDSYIKLTTRCIDPTAPGLRLRGQVIQLLSDKLGTAIKWAGRCDKPRVCVRAASSTTLNANRLRLEFGCKQEFSHSPVEFFSTKWWRILSGIKVSIHLPVSSREFC